MVTPVLRQLIFEARFQQGYRYLDRCGDAMLILEQMLEKMTGHLWMPEQMVPTGARIICPDLEITIAFSSANLVVDRDPIIDDAPCNFEDIAANVYSTLVGRFDLKTMTRFGARRVKVVGTDDIDGAQALSTKLTEPWPLVASGLNPRSLEVAYTWELPDRSKGIRASVKPFARFDAEIEVDERLKQPPHLLPTGQRKALLDRLRRQQTRQRDPITGLLVDIDCYHISPSRDLTPKAFLDQAWQEADQYERELLKRLP